MAENDDTADLTMDEKLNRILSELTSVEARLTVLEALVEERTKETRPKLDLIIKELSDMREEMNAIASAQARTDERIRL